MRAARWLGVAPWDLADVPVIWRERALVAESTEAEVARDRQKQADRKARRGVN